MTLMMATVSWWNQGQLQCFITMWTILEILLQSGRLVLASLNTQVWLLSATLVLRTLYLLHSLQFLVASDNCPPATLLKASVHLVFSRPVFLPVLTSHTDVACAHLRYSIPATWPPHFHLRLRATATMSFMLVFFIFQHSAFCLSIQHEVFSVQSSVDKYGASSLPSPWGICS